MKTVWGRTFFQLYLRQLPLIQPRIMTSSTSIQCPTSVAENEMDTTSTESEAGDTDSYSHSHSGHSTTLTLPTGSKSKREHVHLCQDPAQHINYDKSQDIQSCQQIRPSTYSCNLPKAKATPVKTAQIHDKAASLNGVLSNSGDQNLVHRVLPNTDDLTQELQLACQCLKDHKIIAVPTDTIYGVACSAQSSEAIRKLYQLKGRDAAKPVAICVGDVQDVYRWGKVVISRQLLEELLPGPVTVVLERTEELNQCLNPGTAKVGIRVPDYGFVCQLAKTYGEPMALTSANISSEPSSLCIEEFRHLWPHLHAIFDGGVLGGTLESRQGSTVVDLSNPGTFTVIRPGSAHARTLATLQKYDLQESGMTS